VLNEVVELMALLENIPFAALTDSIVSKGILKKNAPNLILILS